MLLSSTRLVAESGWHKVSLKAVFVNGLSELLKDELVSHPVSKDLDDLISLSIRIDNRCHERRREKRRNPGGDVTPHRREDSPVQGGPILVPAQFSHRNLHSERRTPRANRCTWEGTSSAWRNGRDGEQTTTASTVDSPAIT